MPRKTVFLRFCSATAAEFQKRMSDTTNVDVAKDEDDQEADLEVAKREDDARQSTRHRARRVRPVATRPLLPSGALPSFRLLQSLSQTWQSRRSHLGRNRGQERHSMTNDCTRFHVRVIVTYRIGQSIKSYH